MPLLDFAGGSESADRIPYDRLSDYIELVEWTGMGFVPSKRGSFSGDLPPIIERLGFDEEAWFLAVNGFNRSFSFHDFVGDPSRLREVCERTSRRWIRGGRACACFDKGDLRAA